MFEDMNEDCSSFKQLTCMRSLSLRITTALTISFRCRICSSVSKSAHRFHSFKEVFSISSFFSFFAGLQIKAETNDEGVHSAEQQTPTSLHAQSEHSFIFMMLNQWYVCMRLCLKLWGGVIWLDNVTVWILQICSTFEVLLFLSADVWCLI